jgi:hypothetical protein
MEMAERRAIEVIVGESHASRDASAPCECVMPECAMACEMMACETMAETRAAEMSKVHPAEMMAAESVSAKVHASHVHAAEAAEVATSEVTTSEVTAAMSEGKGLAAHAGDQCDLKSEASRGGDADKFRCSTDRRSRRAALSHCPSHVPPAHFTGNERE